MKVLTKELRNDFDFQEIYCAINSIEKKTMPVVFLNGDEGVAKADIKTVKTQFNISDKENKLNFMVMPATFTFYSDYSETELESEMHSPENDFLSQYINRLRLITYLPEEILMQVKDKRLLAMGYATQKVKKAILRYTNARIKAATKKLERSQIDSIKTSRELTIYNQFKKHSYIYSIEELFDDAYITSIVKKGKDLYIELDGEIILVLSDVETLEEEIAPQNTEVSFFELHKVEQGYELHLLLKIRDENLVESFYYLTYKFKDMWFDCIT
jgi:hypothetical protein